MIKPARNLRTSGHAGQHGPARVGIWLPVLFLLASCYDQPEDVRLSSAVVIGESPTLFSGTQPLLPTHGHDVTVQIYVAPGYHRDSVRFPDGRSWGYTTSVDEHGREIHIRTILIATDGSRIVLHSARPATADGTVTSVFAVGAHAADIRRFQPTGVEITASVPVRVDSVQWWAGDLYPRWVGP